MCMFFSGMCCLQSSKGCVPEHSQVQHSPAILAVPLVSFGPVVQEHKRKQKEMEKLEKQIKDFRESRRQWDQGEMEGLDSSLDMSNT